MKRVLVTGGTGILGKKLVPRLIQAGYTVRVMSRRTPGPGESEGVEWAQASLEEGTGLIEAMDGVNIVIHTASSPLKAKVDVDGTRRLLELASQNEMDHFIYISIVGVDRIDFSYYRNKLAAERLIEASDVPWTILRATQFHEFIDRLLVSLTRLPVTCIPRKWRFQSISAGEVADQLVKAVKMGPSGRLGDIGGPEVLKVRDMARLWLATQGKRRLTIHIPVPGGLSDGFSRGLNTTPEHPVGKVTWSQWLNRQYTEQGTDMSISAVEEPSRG